jgi:CBS domain-containing protein
MPRSRMPTRETSVDHVGPQAVLAQPSETAMVVRTRIRQLHRPNWDLLCIVDDEGRLLGTLTATELLTLPDEAQVGAAAL